jgi:hypothetical protein
VKIESKLKLKPALPNIMFKRRQLVASAMLDGVEPTCWLRLNLACLKFESNVVQHQWHKDVGFI